ncbi:MAG: formylglycine-generating enzyme family protein [Opitutales bacterium]|nr:formylglycine-generating enzyme family protein [Opitutales bacterium]
MMKIVVLFVIILPILLFSITFYFLTNNESKPRTPDFSNELVVSHKDISRQSVIKEINGTKLQTLTLESREPSLNKHSASVPNHIQESDVIENNTSPHELYTPVNEYYKDGAKKMKGFLKDGRLFSAEVWKPNGELCPVTNLSQGNGVLVGYNPWGTQWYRQTYRNGVPISGNQILESVNDSSAQKGSVKIINKTRTSEEVLIKKKMVSFTKLLKSKGLEIELIWCEPGSFMMGSPESEEGRGRDETLHKVTLTRGFFLGKKEITQVQWCKLMKKNPSFYKGKNLPVDSINHEEATLFCQKLNESEKKVKRLPPGLIYKLPTEAQWEYACRAGTQTIYSFGNHLTIKPGNIKKGEGGQATAGSTHPNRWGFHEMHGNLWEWCRDKYKPFVSGHTIDPFCTDRKSKYYVQRSGVGFGSSDLRSALRHHNLPAYKGRANGMRVCLTLSKEAIEGESLRFDLGL